MSTPPDSTPDATTPAEAPRPSAASNPPPDSAKPAESGAGEGTAFSYARRLVEQKVPRPEAIQRLKEKGFDDETARLALNAVDGANPSDLPDATLAPGINPLAPGSFALSDIGMSGNPGVVALYWMAFGAVVMVLVAVFLILPEFGVGDPHTDVSAFWARFGLGMGGLAFAWGVFRLIGTVRVRRR
ncbi:MAG: hypothetical protein AMXMBFR34_32750 [Myxococcaceae bacterium]